MQRFRAESESEDRQHAGQRSETTISGDGHEVATRNRITSGSVPGDRQHVGSHLETTISEDGQEVATLDSGTSGFESGDRRHVGSYSESTIFGDEIILSPHASAVSLITLGPEYRRQWYRSRSGSEITVSEDEEEDLVPRQPLTVFHNIAEPGPGHPDLATTVNEDTLDLGHRQPRTVYRSNATSDLGNEGERYFPRQASTVYRSSATSDLGNEAERRFSPRQASTVYHSSTASDLGNEGQRHFSPRQASTVYHSSAAYDLGNEAERHFPRQPPTVYRSNAASDLGNERERHFSRQPSTVYPSSAAIDLGNERERRTPRQASTVYRSNAAFDLGDEECRIPRQTSTVYRSSAAFDLGNERERRNPRQASTVHSRDTEYDLGRADSIATVRERTQDLAPRQARTVYRSNDEPVLAHPDSAHPDSAHPDLATTVREDTEDLAPRQARTDYRSNDEPSSAHRDLATTVRQDTQDLVPRQARIVYRGNEEPGSAYPDSAHPDSAHPDSAHPDSAYPDLAHPDLANPDPVTTVNEDIQDLVTRQASAVYHSNEETGLGRQDSATTVLGNEEERRIAREVNRRLEWRWSTTAAETTLGDCHYMIKNAPPFQTVADDFQLDRELEKTEREFASLERQLNANEGNGLSTIYEETSSNEGAEEDENALTWMRRVTGRERTTYSIGQAIDLMLRDPLLAFPRESSRHASERSRDLRATEEVDVSEIDERFMREVEEGEVEEEEEAEEGDRPDMSLFSYEYYDPEEWYRSQGLTEAPTTPERSSQRSSNPGPPPDKPLPALPATPTVPSSRVQSEDEGDNFGSESGERSAESHPPDASHTAQSGFNTSGASHTTGPPSAEPQTIPSTLRDRLEAKGYKIIASPDLKETDVHPALLDRRSSTPASSTGTVVYAPLPPTTGLPTRGPGQDTRGVIRRKPILPEHRGPSEPGTSRRVQEILAMKESGEGEVEKKGARGVLSKLRSKASMAAIFGRGGAKEG